MKAIVKQLLITALCAVCTGTSAEAGLTEQIDRIISHPSQRRVKFSIHVVEADSGRTVYEHNAGIALIPASNMKLITSAAAVKYLGADFRYVTKVGLSGERLVVTGSGDPLLGDKETDDKYGRDSDWMFKDIARKLAGKGVKKIESIIIDKTIFDNQRVHPGWPAKDLNRPYACEVSGLNYNDNCIGIAARKTGGKTTAYLEPKTSFVSIINRVRPITTGESVIGSYRTQQPNRIIVHGRCKDKIGPYDVAIEKPAAFFGVLLAESLAKTGIKVERRLVEQEQTGRDIVSPLAEYSTPIRDCLIRCNKDSFGLAAEAMLKTIAANSRADGKRGSWAGGSEVVSEYLARLGIDREQFSIDDGSGLSRENKLSAYAITSVLLDMYRSDDWELYKDSLAAGGIDGTIAKYFKGEAYKGNILGKTGYISGVKSFSGVCTTAEGDYLFSIITNNAAGTTRTAINDIAEAIIDNNKKLIVDY